ncbi:hypothetical protein CVT24_006986 [Panaeolus cyanescens]|uniref:DUF6532 domain-containing protein n=1 Tax=Panaeolus cyanescens TaxID=181874 RepID=A0A409X1M6_9AGAR|nr:hypothetical protein CVT24_006986 [Panaeolus cyanescens]
MEYPPSSDSEQGRSTAFEEVHDHQHNGQGGMSDDIYEDEEETDVPPTIIPEKLLKRKKVKLSKRDEMLVSEQTTMVKTSRTKKQTSKSSRHVKNRQVSHISDEEPATLEEPEESEPDSDPDGEREWPRIVRLARGGLLKQNIHIQVLARKAMAIVERDIHLSNAWPELNRSAAYRLEVLLKAADSLIGKNPKYKAMTTRIKIDEIFCRRVGKWFLDRLPLRRHDVLDAARGELYGYRLGKGEECKVRVHVMLENDNYLHPGAFMSVDDGEITYVSESTPAKPLKFQNPIFIDILGRAFFEFSSSSGFKYQDDFKTSLPDRPQYQDPEITKSMVALAATATYAAIWEMRSGKAPVPKKRGRGIKRKADARDGTPQQAPDAFSGNKLFGVYMGHIEYLEALQAQGRVTYHKLMSSLLKQVMVQDGMAVGGRPDGQPVYSPLRGVDVDCLED